MASAHSPITHRCFHNHQAQRKGNVGYRFLVVIILILMLAFYIGLWIYHSQTRWACSNLCADCVLYVLLAPDAVWPDAQWIPFKVGAAL